MERPGDVDLALVGEAVSALRRGLGPHLHPAATAVRTSDGTVVTGLALRDVACSETTAVGAVLAQGRRAATLVSVRHVSDDATRVTAPCPSCRAMLLVHAPAVRVVHLREGLRVSRVPALP